MLKTALTLGLALTFVGATIYDEATGIKNQLYAAASYCDSTVATWSCGITCERGPKVQEITTISNWLDGTFGYVGYNAQDDEIVVAFRGSHDIANWISNMQYGQADYPGV